MMRGQRGWRELAILGDKMNKFSGMIEGLIWSPRGGYRNDATDNWALEEVFNLTNRMPKQPLSLTINLHFDFILLGAGTTL